MPKFRRPKSRPMNSYYHYHYCPCYMNYPWIYDDDYYDDEYHNDDIDFDENYLYSIQKSAFNQGIKQGIKISKMQKKWSASTDVTKEEIPTKSKETDQ